MSPDANAIIKNATGTDVAKSVSVSKVTLYFSLLNEEVLLKIFSEYFYLIRIELLRLYEIHSIIQSEYRTVASV